MTTRTCERCGDPNVENRDLLVLCGNGEISPAGFHLCESCYRDGEKLEPIRDVDAFLAGPYAGEPGATDWAEPLPYDSPFRNEVDYTPERI